MNVGDSQLPRKTSETGYWDDLSYNCGTMTRFLISILLTFCCTAAIAGMGDWMSFDTVDGEYVVDATFEGIATKASLSTDSLRHSVNESFLKKNDISYHKTSTFDITFMDIAMEISKPMYYEDESEIGMRIQPMFKSGVVTQIDFTQRRIRFMRDSATKMVKNDNLNVRGGTVNSGSMATEMIIDGHDYFFAMTDPRATFTTVSRELAVERGWLEKYQISPAKLGDAAAGLEDYEIMQVPNVSFGPFEFDYAIILAYKASDYDNMVVTDLDNTASKTRFYHGVMGQDVLSNFVLTFDRNRRKAHIYAP